ncbi:metallophosphoesterase [Puniceicoccaceae bacterium K14]|nr:metallophosphoesterase [Puniceicoccaceae bacterium K14]
MNAATQSNEKPTTDFPILPIALFILTWIGASWFTVGVWFHPYVPGGWLAFAASLALVSIPLKSLLSGFSGESYPNARARLFIQRPFWYAMLFLPIIAIGTLAGATIGLPFGESSLFARWSVALTLPGLLIIAIIGWHHSRKLVLNQFDVALPRLPNEFDGLKIAQISDLHVGPHTSQSHMTRIKKAVMQQEPDLVAITGDQVDDFSQDVEHFNDAFAELEAKHGVYAVLGNHDIYADWHPVKRGLEQAGIRVLLNQSISIKKNGKRLWIAGTGDPAASSKEPSQAPDAPDIQRTLEDVPSNEPVIALAHNPALWPDLVKRQVDLTLSGHTHYGQFALPWFGWSLASPFLELAMGFHKREESKLYIHPGTGFWGVPIRFGTPSEVAIITLKSN